MVKRFVCLSDQQLCVPCFQLRVIESRPDEEPVRVAATETGKCRLGSPRPAARRGCLKIKVGFRILTVKEVRVSLQHKLGKQN